MTLSDRDALLAAIIANPEEDIPRLMLADWLQENGEDARGQFIRRQIEVARVEPYSRAARTAQSAAERLLEGRRAEWSRTVRQWVVGWEFGRGFVEHVAVNVANFPHDAERIFAFEPIRSLQPVRFAAAVMAPLDSFFETPQLERITRLDLSGMPLSPVEMEPLIDCPYLAGVADLCLRRTPVMPDWLEAFLLSPAMPALAGLDLGDVTHLGPRLADTLPALFLRTFQHLDLSRITFTSNQIKAVLGSRCLQEVEELRLGWMPGSTREGALTHLDLGWVIPWDRLRLLDLSAQGVGSSGVLEIVRELNSRSGEPHLRWLGLAHNHVGSDGVRALVRSNLNLHHLDLRGNGLSLPDRAALQSRFPDAVIEA